MAGYIQTPGLLMGLWVVGGILTLFGALAYGEMAAALPRAGGQYVFLKEAFSPLWGFLYGWTFLLAINTGFIAAVGVAFAKYLGVFLPAIGEGTVLFSVGRYPFTTAQAVGPDRDRALTWINITGLKSGAMVQNVFTIAKVAAIAVLLILAVASGKGSAAHFQPVIGAALGPEGLKIGLFAAMGVAMSKALFAYDAWNSVTFAAEEMREPEKNLPKALVLGTLGIMAAYCAAVAAYLYMVPIQEMFAVKDNRIAAEAAQRHDRRPRGRLHRDRDHDLDLRLRERPHPGRRARALRDEPGQALLQAAGRGPSVYRTPAPALLLQGGVAAVLTLTGTYNDLLTMVAFVSLLFNTLTVVALFVLRRRRPTCRARTGRGVIPCSRPLHPGFGLLPVQHPGGRSAERRNRPRDQRLGPPGLCLLDSPAGVTSDKSLT
jgi:APA family basic amino acid/polyamine antiporter